MWRDVSGTVGGGGSNGRWTVVSSDIQPAALQIEYVHKKKVLPTDPVFELVYPIFVQYSGLAYVEIGGPEVQRNCWLNLCFQRMR